MGGGGLIQLIEYGSQDIYLTGQPQITFFKAVYRRHTNFAIESFQQTVQGNINFGNSNVLWRATLKCLDFLPLINADYSGGIIIYDWYSESSNSNEQIKITVNFLSNELRTESVEVSSHKKICDQNQKCFTKKTDGDFNKSIKENILAEARKLRIAEEKKK